MNKKAFRGLLSDYNNLTNIFFIIILVLTHEQTPSITRSAIDELIDAF